MRDRLAMRFKRIVFGIGLVLILAVGGLYFFAQTASYESTDDPFVDGHITNVAPKNSILGNHWLRASSSQASLRYQGSATVSEDSL